MSEALKQYDEWQKYRQTQSSDCILFQNDKSLYNKTLSELLDHISFLDNVILELKLEKEKINEKI